MSGKSKNAIYPSSDFDLLSVPNGGTKRKSSPKKKKPKEPGGGGEGGGGTGERRQSKLWTEEISALKHCEEFYIKQTNLQVDDGTFSPCYYDIRNMKGKLVFKGIESVDPAIRDAYQEKGKPPYVLTIFDMKAGKEMLRINANLRQGVMLVYVKGQVEDKVIGIVRQVEPQCPLWPCSFSLERSNGTVLLTIRRHVTPSSVICCVPYLRRLLPDKFQKPSGINQGKGFHILLADEVTNVGSVHYVRRGFDKRDDVESNIREELVSAVFPGDTTATNKALILASLFMLDHLYFQKKRTIRKRKKISTTCWVIMVIVISVIIVSVLAAVFGGRGYQGNKTTPGGRRPGLG